MIKLAEGFKLGRCSDFIANCRKWRSEMKEKLGMWVLIAFLIGIAIGGYGIYQFNDWQMSKTVKMGVFIHADRVYEVKERL